MILVSPLAARLCSKKGIDPSTLRGTGPRGRIMAADVREISAAPVRRGGTVHEDYATPPTRPVKDGYYVYDGEVDMTALEQISIPMAVQGGQLLQNHYSLFDYIIRAVVKACLTCPNWKDPSGQVDVLLFEQQGQRAAAIRNAAGKTIFRIARETSEAQEVAEDYKPHIIICDAATTRQQVADHLSADNRPGFALVVRGSSAKAGIIAGGDKPRSNVLGYTFYVSATLPPQDANRVAATLRLMLYNPIRLLLLS